MNRRGFTLVELIFVIVIVGLISSVIMRSLLVFHDNYLSMNMVKNGSLKNDILFKKISSIIEDRIHGTEIVSNKDLTKIQALSNIYPNPRIFTVFGWYERASFLTDMNELPLLTRYCDIKASSKSYITTPGSDIAKAREKLLEITGVDLYRMDGEKVLVFSVLANPVSDFGWDGSEASFAHKVYAVSGDNKRLFFEKLNSKEISEKYDLSYEAVALSLEDYNSDKDTYNLYYYRNFKPWGGEKYYDGEKYLLAENVVSLSMKKNSYAIEVKICIKSDIDTKENNVFCSEKIFF